MSVKVLAGLLFTTMGLNGQGPAQVRDAAELQILLDRLQVVGSVLYVAAHPDDENTAALAALAKGRKVRTAYLSLTRGGGGQNLIGPELDDALAAIRTQELLAARRVDGAEQYFTRAVDFGYSKTPEESLRFWGRDAILADVVRVIRSFRPDVILTRFPTDGRGGHGHHTASALLAVEAFTAAADPKRFPEQLGRLRPWQAKRVLFNFFRFQDGPAPPAGTVPFDVGAYDPLLGRSYAELAAEGRSQHRSQGFGVLAPRGGRVEYFEHLAGAPAKADILDGVELNWKRIPGGTRVGELLAEARASYRPDRPEAALPKLLEAKAALEALPAEPATEHKAAELWEAIRCAAGIWAEAIVDRPAAAPGEQVPVALGLVVRGNVQVRLDSVLLDGDGAKEPARTLIPNQPWRETLTLALPAGAKPTAPSWATGNRAFLHGTRPSGFEISPEDPAAFSARFRGQILGQPFDFRVPVLHRYRDPVLGERYQPFVVQPAVLVQVPALTQVFADGQPREIHLEITPTRKSVAGRLRFELPRGWRAEPAEWPFSFGANGSHRLQVKIHPPAGADQGELSVRLEMDGLSQPAFGRQAITHPHIPTQTLFPPARLRLVRADIAVSARRIGYVMGAGDEIPQALRLLGCEVELLSDEALAERDLSGFDALVVGIRAFNTRPALARLKDRLLDYVARGGTEIVLYQVNGAFPGTNAGLATESLGPAPFKIGRERVTDEASPVRFLDPEHPVLTRPNPIGSADFDGWVQERGLYFASSRDAAYTPILTMSDPGEKALDGGLIVASHGKGHFVYTGLAFFRQLPDGVPGAYRLFANLLSLGAK